MQSHELQKAHGRVKRRVGRGGKRGSFSGKGIKGQRARSGHRIRPQIRDMIKKIHKRRGQRRGYFARSVASKPAGVNLEVLEKNFNNGDKITPKSLLAKSLIRPVGGKMPKVKILGIGKLTKKLIFDKDLLMSAAVKNKIK
ncbi:MAG: uL15 family ribosomal protein [bacterium]|nr:uL15 family ribosomal protein [bacterium]